MYKSSGLKEDLPHELGSYMNDSFMMLTKEKERA